MFETFETMDRGHIEVVRDQSYEPRDLTERFIRFAPLGDPPTPGVQLCAGYDLVTMGRGGVPGRRHAEEILKAQDKLHENWRPHWLLFLGTRWRPYDLGERVPSIRFTGGLWMPEVVPLDSTFGSAYKVAVFIRQ